MIKQFPTPFFGIIEDIDDPAKLGRVRVRAFGFHSHLKQEVPTEDLPWAIVGNATANVSGLGMSPTSYVCGSLVYGVFIDGMDCQQPLILMAFPSVPAQAPDTTLGFNDPNGVYPAWTEESDVHPRARGEELEGDSDYNITGEYEGAMGSQFKVPDDPYAAEYPKNQIFVTEAGHYIELDNTTDNPRLKIRHASGSFVEIHPDGSVVSKASGSKYSVVLANGNTYIEGDSNVIINGTSAIKVNDKTSIELGDDTDLEIKGDTKITIDGNVDASISGNLRADISGTCDIRSTGVLKLGSDSNIEIDAAGNLKLTGARIDFN